MSDELKELKEQRALIQRHLDWLDAQIQSAEQQAGLLSDEHSPPLRRRMPPKLVQVSHQPPPRVPTRQKRTAQLIPSRLPPTPSRISHRLKTKSSEPASVAA